MTSRYEKYGKKYYLKNKELCLKRNAENRARWRREWWEFKSRLRCIKCGQNHPATLDFHHVNRKDPEKKSVNYLAAQGLYSQAYEEVKKCVVLCANCHRIHHWDERHIQGGENEERVEL